jgi:transposase
VLVDTLGGLLAVVVLAGDVSDRDGAALLLALYRARYPHLVKLWGDSHYGGDLPAEVEADYGIEITVVSRGADQEGFVPLPKRWIVERSLSWLTHCRRLARDYERDPAYSEAWIYVASIHRLLKHLAPDPTLPKPYQRKVA